MSDKLKAIEEQRKYIKYLQTNGKKLPNGQTPILIDFENSHDPVVSIVEAITKGFELTKPTDYKIIEKANLLIEYKSEMYATVLGSGILKALQGEYQDKGIKTEMKKLDEPEEFLAFIFLKSAEEPQIAANFTKGIFEAYYSICEEKSMPYDASFQELIK